MKRLLVALLALSLLAAACGGDDISQEDFDEVAAERDRLQEQLDDLAEDLDAIREQLESEVRPPAAASTSTPPTTTTTAAPTTTTTTMPPTTTTAAPTTTTTAPTTTTTEPPPMLSFEIDGLGVVQFGASPEEVIAALTPILGPPINDTGWIEEIICPGPMDRFIDFGAALADFRLLFTTGDLFAPNGTPHWYGYQYKGATDVGINPPNLTVGTTVAQLQALYPEVQFVPNPFFQGEFDFLIEGPGNQRLDGNLTGTDPGDLVETVRGGGACGE